MPTVGDACEVGSAPFVGHSLCICCFCCCKCSSGRGGHGRSIKVLQLQVMNFMTVSLIKTSVAMCFCGKCEGTRIKPNLHVWMCLWLLAQPSWKNRERAQGLENYWKLTQWAEALLYRSSNNGSSTHSLSQGPASFASIGSQGLRRRFAAFSAPCLHAKKTLIQPVLCTARAATCRNSLASAWCSDNETCGTHGRLLLLGISAL